MVKSPFYNVVILIQLTENALDKRTGVIIEKL